MRHPAATASSFAAAGSLTFATLSALFSSRLSFLVCLRSAHEVKKHTVAQHQRQLGETQAILGDKLRLYQIHSATEASGVLEEPGVLEALAKLRDAGVAVGASVSHPQARPLELATQAAGGDGKPLFVSVQATYNLLDQSAGPYLRAAAEQGVFVIIKEGVANGRLTARNVGSDALALLEAEAAKLSTSVDALALAWILTQPFVGMVLSGASTCEQLQSNYEVRPRASEEQGAEP